MILLLTNPQDIETVVRCGIQLKSLNIDGMSFTESKSMTTGLVSVSQQGTDSFRYLNSQEVELKTRKIPADGKILLMELLAKTRKV